MKKAFVLAIATLVLTSNAFAQRAREGRPRGIERQTVRENMKVNARNAAPTAQRSQAKLEIQQKIDSSGLKISSQAARDLETAAQNPATKAKIEKFIAAKGQNEALATLGLNLISLQAGAKADTPAGKETLNSTVDAVEAAIGWKNDAKAQENIRFFGAEVAERLVKGQKVEAALEGARDQLKKDKSVDLKLEDISKLCKKA